MSADVPHLQVESLGLDLGRFALKGVDLKCAEGEYHILLGPTGSGKSTLMKCILGLQRVDSGRILIGGQDVTQELPERRRMGYVPQNYALFPHLNVEQNIRFGIEAGRVPAGEVTSRLNELCAKLGIEKLRTSDVRRLSGGEKQKVALARALGIRPRTILLDEPFSAIDVGSRRQLWFELKKVVGEIGVTVLHITHNLDEAHVMGERLSVLIGGRRAQTGTPQQILERPAAKSVARFLGYRNVFHGIAQPLGDGTRIDVGSFTVTVSERIRAGQRVGICVRQQDIKIIKPNVALKDSLRHNVISGTLTNLFAQPETCTAWFIPAGGADGCTLELSFPRYLVQRHGLQPGQQVQVGLWEPAIIVWREDEHESAVR